MIFYEYKIRYRKQNDITSGKEKFGKISFIEIFSTKFQIENSILSAKYISPKGVLGDKSRVPLGVPPLTDYKWE